jgi:hypothetical protein
VAPFGELRYNIRFGQMSAVCTMHGNDCRKTRSCTQAVRSSGSSGQGRPLGLLVAWLIDGANHDSRADHFSSVPTLTLANRQDARQFAMRSPEASDFASFEREKRANEADEPMSIS